MGPEQGRSLDGGTRLVYSGRELSKALPPFASPSDGGCVLFPVVPPPNQAGDKVTTETEEGWGTLFSLATVIHVWSHWPSVNLKGKDTRPTTFRGFGSRVLVETHRRPPFDLTGGCPQTRRDPFR